MQINQENYESWMLSYIDGELDHGEVKALMDFLHEHPALEEELTLLQTLKLHPDESIRFSRKSSLYPAPKVIRPAWIILAAAAVLLLMVVLYWGRSGATHHGPILAKISSTSAILSSPLTKPKEATPIGGSLPLTSSGAKTPIGTAVDLRRPSRSARDHGSAEPPVPAATPASPVMAQNPPVQLVALNPLPGIPGKLPGVSGNIQPEGSGTLRLPSDMDSVTGEKTILHIRGSACTTLVGVLARMQRFLSGKNPALARTETVQAGRYEFINYSNPR